MFLMSMVGWRFLFPFTIVSLSLLLANDRAIGSTYPNPRSDAQTMTPPMMMKGRRRPRLDLQLSLHTPITLMIRF